MALLSESQLMDVLNWRYATKGFDPGRRIDPGTWSALEASLVLAPSSFGLQPWKFLVVTDPGLKAQLRAASWDQSQVTDCSHHVVFLVRDGFGRSDIDRLIARIEEVRDLKPEALEGYRSVMEKALLEDSRAESLDVWAAGQVHIALGGFMTAAALLGVDTCPLGGIEPDRYDVILGLEGTGYRTLVACCAGYRMPGDKYASLPKVRFRPEEVIEHR
ncbi:MAG: putative NAD(P)H nitroreductase YfkO [Acidobacteria bacterium ADurb.Bin340]|nr:MAG: putative NAD(P)H nitroreductase YfkO [Acidobacteria bacterium ADurb.Bin340]